MFVTPYFTEGHSRNGIEPLLSQELNVTQTHKKKYGESNLYADTTGERP